MEDLAQELGLSRMTVSKALRGLPGMSLETRRRVMELAKKRGYLTREQKESGLMEQTAFMSGQSRRFLMVLQDDPSHHAVHIQLMKGLNEGYQGTGSHVSPVFMPSLPFKTGTAFSDWVEKSGITYADGIFIPPIIPPDIEEKLLTLPVHRIILNFPPAGAQADSVVWDVYDSVQQATRYLLHNGHRRILYIGDTKRTRGFRLRWSAFLEAMSSYGIAVEPSLHVTTPMESGASWQQAFYEQVKQYQPTAILNTIEHNLPWVHYLCKQAGIRIPEDCSLLSLNAADAGDQPDYPGLTSLHMPIVETGHRAAERMIWRIANPSLPYEHIRLQGRFIIGTSVRSLD